MQQQRNTVREVAGRNLITEFDGLDVHFIMGLGPDLIAIGTTYTGREASTGCRRVIVQNLVDGRETCQHAGIVSVLQHRRRTSNNSAFHFR